MMTFHQVAAKQFLDARARAPRQHMFTPITPAELRDMIAVHFVRAFLDETGRTGFLLNFDGYLQSVFNYGAPGAGAKAVEEAIRQGAVSLDCFAPYLPAYYARFGFLKIGRAPFDPKQAPPGWRVAEHGRPDVVFMRRRK